MNDKRLISGMPLMSDAYKIGKSLIKTEDEYFEQTGKCRETSNQADACIRFATLMDEGTNIDTAWSDAWAFYEYLEYQDEMRG